MVMSRSGVLLDQRVVGVSHGSCDLIEACGQPNGVGEDINKTVRHVRAIVERKKGQMSPENFSASKRIRNSLLALAVVVLVTPQAALACARAPSCWMKGDTDYLKSICRGYAKRGQTLKQIATFVDEPEQVPAFGQACKKPKIRIQAE
jgi:hypothetical protein